MPVELGATYGHPASKMALLFFDVCRYEIENIVVCGFTASAWPPRYHCAHPKKYAAFDATL